MIQVFFISKCRSLDIVSTSVSFSTCRSLDIDEGPFSFGTCKSYDVVKQKVDLIAYQNEKNLCVHCAKNVKQGYL